MSRLFVNTDEFRRDALHFLKTGMYTDAPKGTAMWEEYWNEQTRRSHEGYSVGGVKITGYHYFYLNFCQMLIVPKDDTGIVSSKSASKIQSFPAFWDGDYEYFWSLEIARNGILDIHGSPDWEAYKRIGLQTNILDISGGKHMVVLKARGKGYSYKAGSMLARNFNLGRRSKNYAIANEKGFLIGDGLLSKVWDNVSFLDNHTAWAQPRLKDTDLIKVAGFKERQGTGFVDRGRLNQVVGVTLKNNPDKARGSRGELIFYEEAGKCPGLLKAWEINRPSVEQGAIVAGIQVAFGTGGTEGADYEGLQELFYHPDAYNCLPFENIWDEGTEGTKSGFFVPSYQNWEGFMDKDGNSDNEGAKKDLLKVRELKKGAKDNSALEQTISENPFTPREATLQVSINIFPVQELSIQLNSVIARARHKAYASGKLIYGETGEVIFKPSSDPPPLFSFPLRKGDDERGAVCLLESPIRVNGSIPDSLYLICHDPYAKDKSSSSVSIGAAFVIKMTNDFSHTLNACVVASYVGRPNTMDDYNDTLFKLAKYYNARIAFENNRGAVVDYAKRFKLLQFLYPEPQILSVKTPSTSGRTGGSKSYGMTMNQDRKDNAETYMRDWLLTVVGTNENGEETRVLNTILDPALLQELIRYNKNGNFDRVSALMVGMFFMQDLKANRVVPRTDRGFLGNLMARQIGQHAPVARNLPEFVR